MLLCTAKEVYLEQTALKTTNYAQVIRSVTGHGSDRGQMHLDLFIICHDSNLPENIFLVLLDKVK